MRRIVLFLATMLVAPLAVVASAPSAQALGQRTQTFNTGYFKASITVNWKSKHSFTMWGWIQDTRCDNRGVYLDHVYQEHPKAGGGYAYGPYWYIGLKDSNGCNNGRVKLAKHGYTLGKRNVPLLQVRITSEDKERGDALGYRKVYNNPYIDG